MKKLFEKAGAFFGNRWVKFAFVAVVYVLWFVVWSRSPWMLLGLPVIYDIYISKFISRRILAGHNRRKAKNRRYREVWSWVDALLFAVVGVTIINIYIFQMFKIPTPSMEQTLLVGDHLCVSKVAYGPRMPNTPLSFPLVHNTMPGSLTRKSYSELIRWPYKRLAGLGHVKRDDIVVFNYPAGDTILLRAQNLVFYREMALMTRVFGSREKALAWLDERYTVMTRPVDKRENYVKRCVAIAGDTLRIVAGQVYINGVKQKTIEGNQMLYRVELNDGSRFGISGLHKLGLTSENLHRDMGDGANYLHLTEQFAARLSAMQGVVSVSRVMEHADIFPHMPDMYPWTLDDFGPLWIPAKGATVSLTLENLPFYERIISAHEGNRLEVRDGMIYINGSPAESYTFGMDYYFMMGDNRHNSLDSRMWGFVPEDHVVGKPVFIFWSRSRETGTIRWNRIFSNPK
jgi:signal peptidase I